jgi:glutamate dehydrogenase
MARSATTRDHVDMPKRNGERREAHIREVQAASMSGAPHLAPHTAEFLFETDSAELTSRVPEALAACLAAHSALGSQRLPGTVAVAIIVPGENGFVGDRAAVQVVVDDMPFLVDTLSMAIRRCGFDVELLMHPILHVERSDSGALKSVHSVSTDPAESWMHADLDRIPSPAEAEVLVQQVVVSLNDVRAAVTDWSAMQARAKELAIDLRSAPASREGLGVSPGGIEPEEAASFVEWLLNENFTFLGAVDHRIEAGGLTEVDGSGLGILRAHTGGTPISEIIAPSADWSADELILVTKTMATSKVHRQGNYDIVVIKRYGSDPTSPSEPIGERRLVGLFTSEAYLRSPLEVPLLRGKVRAVIERSDLAATSHSGKELKSILVSQPRDELFASSIDDLYRTTTGILAIGERRRTRLFARYDNERSAWNCQVYLPRDRYTTDVRLRMQNVLETAFGATESSYTTQLSDARLARIVFTVPTTAATDTAVDLAEVEELLGFASQTWSDSLAHELTNQFGVNSELVARYRDAFPPAYTAETPLHQAIGDVLAVDAAFRSQQTEVRFHRNTAEDVTTADIRLSLYSPGSAIALADLLPVLSNLGIRVIDEKADGVEVEASGNKQVVWIHDLGVCGAQLATLDPEGDDAQRLCHAVSSAWTGEVDNDGFNQLVTGAAMTSFEANVLRFYARHARQLGLAASLEFVVGALLEHPTLSKSLVDRFMAKFKPEPTMTVEMRTFATGELTAQFEAGLETVPSLDHDRIFRMLSAQIDSSIRTNAFQTENGALAVKLETRRIPDAPQPRPLFEIFVSCPRVEGVHLRMGSVARGGLRWSDRHEDFRTEILGLMKAQAVKNAVIVPAGAKGGFVVRSQFSGGDRNLQQAEGIACYQTFIRALLDVTDNIVDGVTVGPPDVVRWDSDDPYLVVAADKGTATFSDIANAISLERGHWLGDAFASGGSVGYDHKAMGITARGAWESVKRHFLRRGRNITAPDALPFTVVGIGDMSGDVFGNGMLLSNRIALVAAFDHRHIFIDPTPDASRSFTERQRLFSLPRSSWADYDTTCLSEGGAVYSRTAKTIELSVAAMVALGLCVDGVPDGPHDFAPNDVLRAILRAPVDLLWNGGIGTYIKASTETHAQVGDKANDLIRVDATELRCSIVGEGGNLGVTQRGRVEYAARLRHDPLHTIGWINTDAIDNSAGVDTSDHEVNLKILVDRLVLSGKLPGGVADRNELLASLTHAVAELVLADNIDQNRLLGNLYAEGPGMIDLHARYVQHLEDEGQLDRTLEALPSVEGFAGRKASHGGLTIPELAVLVAHTKLAITEELVEAKLADEAVFADYLRAYFPGELVERLGDTVLTHPLRHEILATVLANRLVNHNGITLVFRMAEETHAGVPDIVRAHTAAMQILGVDSYWAGVCQLDGQTPDADIVHLLLEADRSVERVTRWLLRNRTLPLDVKSAIGTYQPAIAELGLVLDKVSSAENAPGSDTEALINRAERFRQMGLSAALARQGAQFEFATSLLDVVVAADATGFDRKTVGEVHFALDDLLVIGRLRRRILRLPREDRWDALARSSLRDDLAGEHAALTRSVLAFGISNPTNSSTAIERVQGWMQLRHAAVTRHLELVEQTESILSSALAALSVVLRQLRTLSNERTG